jgi:hypothetical protein
MEDDKKEWELVVKEAKVFSRPVNVFDMCSFTLTLSKALNTICYEPSEFH